MPRKGLENRGISFEDLGPKGQEELSVSRRRFESGAPTAVELLFFSGNYTSRGVALSLLAEEKSMYPQNRLVKSVENHLFRGGDTMRQLDELKGVQYKEPVDYSTPYFGPVSSKE